MKKPLWIKTNMTIGHQYQGLWQMAVRLQNFDLIFSSIRPGVEHQEPLWRKVPETFEATSKLLKRVFSHSQVHLFLLELSINELEIDIAKTYSLTSIQVFIPILLWYDFEKLL